MPDPETRPSLLLRVRDACDQDAWAEFAAIYQPVIRAMAIGRGMQSADVDDLVQQVMMAIAGAIDRFEPDEKRRAVDRPTGRDADGRPADALIEQFGEETVVRQEMTASWINPTNGERRARYTDLLLRTCFIELTRLWTRYRDRLV